MNRLRSSASPVIAAVVLLLAAIGLYGILPQLGGFDTSLQALRRARPEWVLGALTAIIFSYVFAAGLYMVLAIKRLRFVPTLTVQLAGLFVNRVVPGGIGGLGLNFLYLRTMRHSATQAGSVALLNNLIGSLGHVILLGGILVYRPDLWSDMTRALRAVPALPAAGLAIVLIVGTVLLGSRLATKTKAQAIRQLRSITGYYRQRPGRLVMAIGLSCCLTALSALCLWLCTHAVHIDIAFGQVFLIYTLGVMAGTATPAPGGLGGLEAALVGGLVLAHIAAPLALAAVLLFRLVSFWLGLLVGVLALLIVKRQKLVLWQA